MRSTSSCGGSGTEQAALPACGGSSSSNRQAACTGLSVLTAAAAPTHLVQPACADVQVLAVHSGVQLLALWRLLLGLLAVCALVRELERLLVREQSTRSGGHQKGVGRLATAPGVLAALTCAATVSSDWCGLRHHCSTRCVWNRGVAEVTMILRSKPSAPVTAISSSSELMLFGAVRHPTGAVAGGRLAVRFASFLRVSGSRPVSQMQHRGAERNFLGGQPGFKQKQTLLNPNGLSGHTGASRLWSLPSHNLDSSVSLSHTSCAC